MSRDGTVGAPPIELDPGGIRTIRWSVNAARMAVCAPWLVLVLLATQQETLAAYDSAAGTLILVVGAVLSVGAYRLMLRIGRLPEDQRVLR